MENPDMVLCGTPKLYGLVHNGEWLIQAKGLKWYNRMITKYYRMIYCSAKQAESAQKKIFNRYNIVAEIQEISCHDENSN